MIVILIVLPFQTRLSLNYVNFMGLINWKSAGASSGFDAGRKKVDLKGFIENTYPNNIFDVIQYWYDQLKPNRRGNFQIELNDILEEEGCPWRFYDRDFIQIDSKFLEETVLKRTQELLEENQFLGAMEEFKEARNDLSSGDFKGAILNSCKAYESVMKILLNRNNGTAKQLIEGLIGKGIINEIPNELHTQFSEKVFQSVPFIRNKLAGHGQGEKVIDIPKEIAELCLHFSAALILFFARKVIAENSISIQNKNNFEKTEI